MNFSDLREQIIKELQNPERKFNIPEQVAIFEGFVGTPFYNVLAVPTKPEGIIPMVMLIGASGQTYSILLKVILPDLDFSTKEISEQDK